MWVYFWTCYLAALICISVFVPVPYCFNYCALWYSVRSRSLNSPAPFFLKIVFTIQGLSCFHAKCKSFVLIL